MAESNNNSNVSIYKLDLSSFGSIREFAAKIIETQPKVDILIHNAGYANVKSAKTIDNIEMTMAVNCYGPFLLTNLLMGLMKKSAPSKIITVASKTYTLSNFDPRNASHLNPIDCWFPLCQYANSKFASFLLNYELARRLEGSGVTANILNPGTFRSPIWDKNTPWYFRIFTEMGKLFMKTIEQGAQTTLYVALSKDVDGLNGRYFRNCKETISTGRTQNKELQGIMYEEALKIVNPSSHETSQLPILNTKNDLSVNKTFSLVQRTTQKSAKLRD
jgi:NAD(P)-dependent dehydrogenase (short-subunit alcohol dehydrogenase family)